MGALERIDTIVQQHADERALRVAVLAELRVAVPFDAFAWLLTDPVSCVASSPVAEVPVLADLPRVIGEYLSTVNRWTSLQPGVAATLVGSHGNDRRDPDPWCSMLAIVRYPRRRGPVALRDAFGCWGFIDLWRRSGTFVRDECATLGAVPGLLSRRCAERCCARSRHHRSGDVDGPAVLLLTDDLAVVGRTDPSEHYLRALLPAEAGDVAIPAAAFNVAAQLLAVEFGVDERPAMPGSTFPALVDDHERGTGHCPDRRRTDDRRQHQPTPPAERTALYGVPPASPHARRTCSRPWSPGPTAATRARHPGDLRAHLAGSPQVDLRQDRRRLTPVAHRPRHRCDEVIGGSAATTPAAPLRSHAIVVGATTERATSNRVAA